MNQRHSSRVARWIGILKHGVDRRLHTNYLRFVSLTVLGMSLLMLAVSLGTWDGNRTVFGPALGADFTGFYVAGTILNGESPERLYDLELQNEHYHRLLPRAPAEESLPYVYPPFFTLLFRPLAAIPYVWSYLVWLAMSVVLFLASFSLTVRIAPTLTGRDRLTALLLCLSFEPLVIECWLGGQTSAFGLFWLTLAIWCDRSNRPWASGLALSVCLYKPTLLLLIIPLLAIAGRWRILLGFALGATVWLGVSALAVGWPTCTEYGLLLTRFTQAASGGSTVLRGWKYVDLVSFIRLLTGDFSFVGVAALLAIAVPVLSLQALVWRRIAGFADGAEASVAQQQAATLQAWSSTLSWTLVLNLYVGIYDTVLVLPGLLLTADALRSAMTAGQQLISRTFTWLLILLYVTPWFSQGLAMHFGFQLDTLILAAAAAYQLRIARQAATA